VLFLGLELLKERKKGLFDSIDYSMDVIDMAKLYVEMVDERGVRVGKIGRREIDISIYFGSRDCSRLAQRIRVKANGSEMPDIQVEEVRA
jgi:hypothetical protein